MIPPVTIVLSDSPKVLANRQSGFEIAAFCLTFAKKLRRSPSVVLIRGEVVVNCWWNVVDCNVYPW